MPRSGRVGMTDTWQPELETDDFARMKHPPKKLSMEPEHDGFSKRVFPFFQGLIVRFHVKLQGCMYYELMYITRLSWYRLINLKNPGQSLEKGASSHDGFVPSNFLGNEWVGYLEGPGIFRNRFRWIAGIIMKLLMGWCSYHFLFIFGPNVSCEFPDVYLPYAISPWLSLKKIRATLESKNKNWWLSKSCPQMHSCWGSAKWGQWLLQWVGMKCGVMDGRCMDGWIHSFVRSFVPSFLPSFIHSFIHSWMDWLVEWMELVVLPG